MDIETPVEMAKQRKKKTPVSKKSPEVCAICRKRIGSLLKKKKKPVVKKSDKNVWL